MSIFEWIVLIGGICGLIMVAGSMLLLYKGVVTLREVAPENAVSIEFRNMVKVSTHYPALGLFLIGLVFIIVSAFYGEQIQVRKIKIAGTLLTEDSPIQDVTVHISAGPWLVSPDSDGQIKGLVLPSIDMLRVEVHAPGYERSYIVKSIDIESIKGGTAEIGAISLGKRTYPALSPDTANIEPLEIELPPLTTEGRVIGKF